MSRMIIFRVSRPDPFFLVEDAEEEVVIEDYEVFAWIAQGDGSNSRWANIVARLNEAIETISVPGFWGGIGMEDALLAMVRMRRYVHEDEGVDLMTSTGSTSNSVAIMFALPKHGRLFYLASGFSFPFLMVPKKEEWLLSDYHVFARVPEGDGDCSKWLDMVALLNNRFLELFGQTYFRTMGFPGDLKLACEALLFEPMRQPLLRYALRARFDHCLVFLDLDEERARQYVPRGQRYPFVVLKKEEMKNLPGHKVCRRFDKGGPIFPVGTVPPFVRWMRVAKKYNKVYASLEEGGVSFSLHFADAEIKVSFEEVEAWKMARWSY